MIKALFVCADCGSDMCFQRKSPCALASASAALEVPACAFVHYNGTQCSRPMRMHTSGWSHSFEIAEEQPDTPSEHPTMIVYRNVHRVTLEMMVTTERGKTHQREAIVAALCELERLRNIVDRLTAEVRRYRNKETR